MYEKIKPIEMFILIVYVHHTLLNTNCTTVLQMLSNHNMAFHSQDQHNHTQHHGEEVKHIEDLHNLRLEGDQHICKHLLDDMF